MAFALVQIIYWLGLSTWFGGLLFIALAAPVIFRTVREADPTLPTVLSVNLERQHSSLLAATIVGRLISILIKIELACAAIVLLGLIGQWFIMDRGGTNWVAPLLRSAMYLLAVGIVIYDWLVIWPAVQRYRDEYIEHADEPEIANPAKEHFDRLHRDSVLLLSIRLAALLGMILFSSTIAPASGIRFERVG
jgi:hypothetical protein